MRRTRYKNNKTRRYGPTEKIEDLRSSSEVNSDEKLDFDSKNLSGDHNPHDINNLEQLESFLIRDAQDIGNKKNKVNTEDEIIIEDKPIKDDKIIVSEQEEPEPDTSEEINSIENAEPLEIIDIDKESTGSEQRSFDDGNNKAAKKPFGKRILKTLLIVFGSMMVLAIVAAAVGYIYITTTGKYNSETMYTEEDLNLPESVEIILNEEDQEKEETGTGYVLEDGEVLYNDEVYEYNEDIVNILFMGVDRKADYEKRGIITGGHADTLLLASINTATGELTVLSIPRDTLTEVKMFDVDLNFAGYVLAPITTSFAYGDGEHFSAALTVDTVSDLLYSIPINRYFAMNVDAIEPLTDAVGGVTVQLLDDFTAMDRTMEKGTIQTLDGEQAKMYVIARREEGMIGGDLGSRIPRQLQFADAFLRNVKKKTTEDITFPFILLNTIKDYTYHNIKTNEVSHLAQFVLNDNFSARDVIVLPGEKTDEGYIIDIDVTHKMIIDIFYIKKDMAEVIK